MNGIHNQLIASQGCIGSTVKEGLWEGFSVSKKIAAKAIGADASVPSTSKRETTLSCKARKVFNAVNQYNPMGIMKKSSNPYVKKAATLVQEEFDSVFSYLLSQPHKFAPLLVAMGLPISPDTLWALTLEKKADYFVKLASKSSSEVLNDYYDETDEKSKHLMTILEAVISDVSARKVLQNLLSHLEAHLYHRVVDEITKGDVLEKKFDKLFLPEADKPKKTKRKFYRP